MKRRNTSFWIFGTILSCLAITGPAIATVVPDSTLNSTVTPAPPDLGGNNVILIEGGTSAGNNLFHSFQEFSIPMGSGAVFNNAPDINNIFSRVTGGSISNIDGFIGANGTANLFLLNPNGIIFGPNASLNLGGSFLGTSAESIVFQDGSSFSATNTGSEPLLTVSVPVGLQFGNEPGDIVNRAEAIDLNSIPVPGGQGTPPGTVPTDAAIAPGAIPTDSAVPPGAIPPGAPAEPGMPSPDFQGSPPPAGLQVQPGKTVALVGGNAFLPGGVLTAPQGRIELGAVGNNSLVGLSQNPTSFALDYSGVENLGDIQLSQSALVDVSGSGAGSVQLQGAEVALTQGSQIIANTGDIDGGGITIRASESLDLISGGPRGPSGLLAQTVGAGAGGSIDISTQRLTVQDGAQVSSQVTASGGGGSITVNASESLELIGSPSGPTGLVAQTFGTGAGGSIDISTQRLTVLNGAQVSAQVTDTGSGAGGSLTVNASESVEVSGTVFVGQELPSALGATTLGAGQGGNLTIATGQLIVSDRATIRTDTGLAQSTQSPSNIEVGAPQMLLPLNTGNAGNLTIGASQLIVRNDASVIASTFSNGDGGDIEISARESVEVSNAGIFSQAEPGSGGNGGNLIIETPQLSILNGGQVSTGTIGSGNGGDLTVETQGGLVEVIGAIEIETPEGRQSLSSALVSATNGNGNAGNLTIDTGQLIIREGQVSADTAGAGQGGNLTVNAAESVEVSGQFPGAPEPAVLSVATSGSGDGGNLEINTQRLTITESARVSARTSGEGRGGTLTVNASESVEVIGEESILSAGSVMTQDNAEIPSPRARVNTEAGSAISSLTLQEEGMTVNPSEPDNIPPLGEAGNLNITTGQLTVRDGAEVSVSGEGTGAAGDLTINANDEIRLDSGSIEAETDTNPPSGDSANIEITTPELLLSNNSQITAEASGQADGGNIQITTDTLVAGDDSDISANAFAGDGGNIQIDTTADIRSFDSSITASSRLGIDGNVDVNRPEIDPASGLAELEEEPVDPESLIARGCDPNSQQGGRFFYTGRGGVPPAPGNSQGGDGWYEDFRPIDSDGQSSIPSSLSASDNAQPIVEARGWQFDEKGQIVLTAEGGQNTLHPTPYTLHPNAGCDGVAHSSGKPKQLEERSPSSFPSFPKQIVVEEFQVVGSTVFEPEEFAEVLEDFTNRPLSFDELLSARQAVSQLYPESGYITSGVYLPPQTVADGTVEMKAQENGLEEINIISENPRDRRLGNYVKSRLERATSSKPANPEKIVEALRLLQLEQDLIENISAELAEGSRPGLSVLTVEITGKRPSGTEFSLDNRRSPSVGSLRGAANLYHANLLGLGDRLDLSYSRTEGSNTLEFDYAVPINSSNTTLGFRFSNADSDVVEPPFDRLDIDAKSRNYELTLRQPLIQRASDDFTREFALGLTASRRESETSLLGDRFPLSAGANDNGETRISALRFFQEWTQQEGQQVFALRSQFSLGLGAFDATINNDEPDSRFFAWRGQGQWARSLGRRSLLLLRGDLQLATTSLLSSEQFGIGGFNSVRGYRQDARLTDNGAFASIEARLPIPLFSGTDLVQIIPFLDAGTGWNSGDREDPSDRNLLSAGLGLRYQFSDIIDARLDFGIPLIDIDSSDRTWQDNGIYFSIKVNPF